LISIKYLLEITLKKITASFEVFSEWTIAQGPRKLETNLFLL